MSFRVGFTDAFRLGIDFDQERERFAAAGIEFQAFNCRSEEDIIQQMQDFDVHILVAAPYTKRVLESLPRLKGVCRFGIGVDTIDINTASALQIKVCNDTGYCVEEVAMHAMALILDLYRKLTLLDRSVRSGQWSYGAGYEAKSLLGATVGLLGCGNIARILIGFLQPFHCRILVYDPFLDAETIADRGGEKVELGQLLAESDVVSVHCHLTPETRHMLSAEQFRQMKPDAFLVNVSRGGVVDTRALAQALREGRLCGAGLDVHEEEPLGPEHPLRDLDQVILTPHAAHYSGRAFNTIRRSMADQAIAILYGEMPKYLFNREQLGL